MRRLEKERKMEYNRTRYEYNRIHRSRSPTCMKNHIDDADLKKYQRKYVKNLTKFENVNKLDLLLQNGSSFSYDCDKLKDLTDFDSSIRMDDLDVVFDHSSSRCEMESTDKFDYSANESNLDSAHGHLHQRSHSLPVSSDRRSVRVRFKTPSEKGMVNIDPNPTHDHVESCSEMKQDNQQQDDSIEEIDSCLKEEEILNYYFNLFLNLNSFQLVNSIQFYPILNQSYAGSSTSSNSVIGYCKFKTDSIQNPTIPSSNDTTPTSIHPLLTLTHPIDLPPQVYPGKINPSLPPPLPSDKPVYQITFPRPFRRKLSPLAIPLPPSPPPEFDFSNFENSLDLSSHNLLDDSPCMLTSDVPLPDSTEHLIDLSFDDATYETHLSNRNTNLSMKDLPTSTGYNRFSPLPPPVISERFSLSPLYSSPSSSYIPTSCRIPYDNFNPKEGSKINAADSSSQQVAPQPTPFDQVPSAPEKPTSSDKRSISSHKNPSSRGPPSKPSSQIANEENNLSIGTCTKKSHSHHTSVNQSTNRTHPDQSPIHALTEVTLKLHLHNDRSKLVSDCGVARSRVATPSEPYSVNDAASRKTHWTPGEPKDAELESLHDLKVERQAQRAEELSQMRHESEKFLKEHDRDFEELTEMVLEIKDKRQMELIDPNGIIIRPSAANASSHSSPLFGLSIRSPTVKIPFSPTHQRQIYPSQTNSHASPMREDIVENLRQASASASIQAEVLINKIKNSSRASSIKTPAKTRSIIEGMSPPDQNNHIVTEEETKSNLEKGTSTPVLTTEPKAASRLGAISTPRIEPLSKAPSTSARSKAPSVQTASISPRARESVAHSPAQPSRAASNLSRSASTHDRQQMVLEDEYRSRSVATGLHTSPHVPRLHEESGSRVQTVSGSVKVPVENFPSAPASKHTESIRAPSDTKGSRVASIVTKSRAPPSTRYSRAESIITVTRNASVVSMSRAPSDANGSRAAPNAGGSRATSVVSRARAPSNTTNAQALTETRSIRLPENETISSPRVVAENPLALSSDETPAAQSNTRSIQAPLNSELVLPSADDGIGVQAISVARSSRAPSNAGGCGPPSINRAGSKPPSNFVTSRAPSEHGGGAPSRKSASVPASPKVTNSRASRGAESIRSSKVAPSHRTAVVAANIDASNELVSNRGSSQSGGEVQLPPVDDAKPEPILEKPESIKSPSDDVQRDQSIKAASIKLADGIASCQKPVSTHSEPQVSGDDGGIVEENAVTTTEVNGNEGKPPTEPPTLDKDISERAEITPESLDDDNKINRQVYPNITNPLGRWIRFGRAGFRFHIITAHPDIYGSRIPE